MSDPLILEAPAPTQVDLRPCSIPKCHYFWVASHLKRTGAESQWMDRQPWRTTPTTVSARIQRTLQFALRTAYGTAANVTFD